MHGFYFSCEVSVILIPQLRYWDKVSSKLNVVCEAKGANQSSEIAICSFSCVTPNRESSYGILSHNLSPTQLEAKTSTGTKKILSDEDIAEELKKLVNKSSFEFNPKVRMKCCYISDVPPPFHSTSDPWLQRRVWPLHISLRRTCLHPGCLPLLWSHSTGQQRDSNLFFSTHTGVIISLK